MKILVAEDDPINLMLLQGILKPLGQEITQATNGTQALAFLQETTFDLLLFDVMMPGTDGLTLTRSCRQDPRHRDVPILLLTALSGKDDLLKGFEAGATDYVSKPFHAAEIHYRVKAHLQLRTLQLTMEATMNRLNLQMLEVERKQQELEAKERELQEANRLLAEANKRLLEFASKDALTGLLNRRKGWDYMNYEQEKARRSHKPLGIALMDLDKFKSVNDTLGHETGDVVLKTATTCLAGVLRGTDILIRWGGEEFLAVFPETDQSGLSLVAEKLRSAVEAYPWDLKDRRRITVSVGTAVKLPDDPWDQAIDRADRALYRSKESGRNRVTFEP
ncbi:MAG TPA: diguanylate cyclase [Spirochaetia bacterium]|nr:diguanylate cyclase [Spirochaetia bacterium]